MAIAEAARDCRREIIDRDNNPTATIAINIIRVRVATNAKPVFCADCHRLTDGPGSGDGRNIRESIWGFMEWGFVVPSIYMG
jgi:hypothetical protein